MSSKSFYLGILARDKASPPTLEESRRDFQALLDARLTSMPYV
jgi:hypothetical protein